MQKRKKLILGIKIAVLLLVIAAITYFVISFMDSSKFTSEIAEADFISATMTV